MKPYFGQGRFDFVLELPPPDVKAGAGGNFYGTYQGKPLGKDVNLASLAKETDGMTGAADCLNLPERLPFWQLESF